MDYADFLTAFGLTPAKLWAIIIFLASVFIDWRPEFKWNPWKSLIKFIGSNFNNKIDAKMNSLRADISALDKKIESVQNELAKHVSESEAKSLQDTRRDILEFCNCAVDEQKTGKKRTREQWDFMIHQCDWYIDYIELHAITNGVIEAAIKEIKKLYQEHIHNGDFLKEGEHSNEQ